MANRRTRAEVDFITKYTGRSNMRQLSGDIRSATGLMKRMAGGALAVGGIGGLAYMLKRTKDNIDATAKLSDRLGMTTEKLIGLQHAAKINGVEQSGLNKSMEVFSKRLGEVDMGVGQARYALDKLGLSADALAEKAPDEAIAIVADQIKNLETQSEKAAAANYLFGRSGTQLLNLFEQGSAGLAHYQAEVERLGVTYSRVDAANVEAANDALARMKDKMQGVVNKITIEMAPHIESLADLMTDTMDGGVDMGGAVTSAFASMSIGAMKFGKALLDVQIAIESVRSAGENKLTKMMTQAEIRSQALKRYRIETGDERAGRLKPKMIGSWAPSLPYPVQQPDVLKRITKQLTAENMPDIENDALKRSKQLAADLAAGIKTIEGYMAKKAQRVARFSDRLEPGVMPAAAPEGPGTPDADTKKLQASTEALTRSLQDQIATYELINSGRAKSLEMAGYMIQAEKAYGEGSSAAADAVQRYGMALDKFNQLREASARQAQRQQDITDSKARVQEHLQGMRYELDMIGKIGNSWERSREYAQFHADAVKAAAGNLDLYNEYMREAERLHNQAQLAEKWAQVSDAMEYSMASAFERMAFEAQTFGDAAKAVARATLVEFARVSAFQPLAQAGSSLLSRIGSSLASGFFNRGASMASGSGAGVDYAGEMSVGVNHAGGRIGITPPSATRIVPRAAFAGAERWHAGNGIKPNERAVIMEVGEWAIPDRQVVRAPGGLGSGPVNVDIKVENNGTSQAYKIRDAVMQQGDLFIALVAQDIDDDGPVSDAIDRKQVAS